MTEIWREDTMRSFEGKVGLVTGGGSGIGRGICLALADAGANLIVADIDLDNAARVAEEVTGKGIRGIPVHVDVRKTDSVARTRRDNDTEDGRRRHRVQQRRGLAWRRDARHHRGRLALRPVSEPRRGLSGWAVLRQAPA